MFLLSGAAGAAAEKPEGRLLAPGSTSVRIDPGDGSCRYSVSREAAFEAGRPLGDGWIEGLSPDPRVVNRVYLQCGADGRIRNVLEYRALAAPDGQYPRIASIWWGQHILQTAPAQAARIQLYLAPFFTPEEARRVRDVNPHVLILEHVNAQETSSGHPEVPAAYYLLDTKGKRIEDWPGNFVLNLTRPEVAIFLAHYADSLLTESHFAFDGIFFDNFVTSISWLKTDIHGHRIAIDSNGDGREDDPSQLDAAWRAGVYRLMAEFRKLEPEAYTSAHLGPSVPEAETLAAFDGESIGYAATTVREGGLRPGTQGIPATPPFAELWQRYMAWFAPGRRPGIAAIQSSPPNQIAYGYGFRPLDALPPATVEFGRQWFANMRFGLALALMGDGYFVHDFGDTTSPVAWWYDEYDCELGTPLGPATEIATGVWRRDFSGGSAILNGTGERKKVDAGAGYLRIAGSQAPKWDFVVDDSGKGPAIRLDSGMRVLQGPYYHAWRGEAHVLKKGEQATWELAIPEDGEYRIEAWLPAAPEASRWTRRAVYELSSGGRAVAEALLDQSAAASGDRWHAITAVTLRAGPATLTLRNNGREKSIADAVRAVSRARYNDGAAVREVTLEPWDGIVLRRR